MTPALRESVAAGESRLAHLESLREGGLKSLAASGSLRIISGDTSVRELMDAVGPSFWPELAKHYGTTFQNDPQDAIPEPMVLSPGVLLMSNSSALVDALTELLKPHGYRVLQAPTREEAQALLVQDEEIVFIVGDIDDSLTLAEAQAWFLANRAQVAWARLPAAVLIPAALSDTKDALRDSGVMGTMFDKPFEGAALVEHIRRSRAF
jgi:hypothetical protein